jgi:alcohol dehydrogenase
MGSAIPQRDVPRFLELYRAGQLRVDGLVSQTVELSTVNAAFDALHEGKVLRQLVRF